MELRDWIVLGGFLLNLGGLVFKSGELKRTIAELEKRSTNHDEEIKTLATKVELAEVNMRQKEDRAKNDKRFEELFISRNQHETVLASISTNMQNLVDAIGSLKSDFRLSISELKEDIRNAKCS
jgi:hypothetical protein